MIIQIYAFTQIKDALQAVSAGVDHIGFVAGKYDLVKGELDFKAARSLAKAIPKPAKSVALTMSTDINGILRMVDVVQPDILHISSETDAFNIDQMMVLHDRIEPDIKLMKAIAVSGSFSINNSIRFASVSDILLLDTKVIGLPGVGATGRTHDWNISREIVNHSPIPVILAGGLTARNVCNAIYKVKPWGVDSNTSTNIPGDPFAKDIGRIREFVHAIRSMEEKNHDA